MGSKHRCWWCNELFEEHEMFHSSAGWLCKACFCYIKGQEEEENNG